MFPFLSPLHIQTYPPSSVTYGDTFPLEGEGYCAGLFRYCFEMLAFALKIGFHFEYRLSL